jgi:hypothetical protein
MLSEGYYWYCLNSIRRKGYYVLHMCSIILITQRDLTCTQRVMLLMNLQKTHMFKSYILYITHLYPI